MKISKPFICKCNRYLVDIYTNDGIFYSKSAHFNDYKVALDWSKQWCNWANKVEKAEISSIYYILQVPDTWPGPMQSINQYHGLFVKIGRSNNVLKRLSNLQTGTYGQLILHALEPGSSQREIELHKQFSEERRSGEWFACTPRIVEHIIRTWCVNKMLPPSHQYEVLKFLARSKDYKLAYEINGKPFQTINPSLNDEWIGNTFVDLMYSSLAKKK